MAKITHIVHIYFLNGQYNTVKCENLQRAQNIAKYAREMSVRDVFVERLPCNSEVSSQER